MKRLPSLLLLPLLGIVVYGPGLAGGFMFDDYPNIVFNSKLQLQSFTWDGLVEAGLSGTAGPLKRPLAMASFAVNHLWSGYDPFAYKLTNLSIHLVNGLLVYALIRLLFTARTRGAWNAGRAHWLALATAAVWIVHPINLSSVLYIVQRMNSLATLFTLAGLICYLWGRIRLDEGKQGFLWLFGGTLAFGTLGVLSKENGLLLPLYALVLELFLSHYARPAGRARKWIIAYFTLLLVVPAFAAAAYLILYPEWLSSGYLFRPFTLTERLLTEPRVLWFYLSVLFFPNSARMGLFHDDMLISEGLFSPAWTGFAVLGLFALVFLAWWARRRAPMLSFAILWFLAGHVMESSALALELVHEHRNYLPSLGPIAAVSYYLLRLEYTPLMQRAMRMTMVLMIGLFGLITAVRADQWRDPVSLATVEVAHHPRSHRAHYQLARIYHLLYEADANQAFYQRAKQHLEAAVPLNENIPKPLFALIVLAYEGGEEPAPELIDLLDKRLREKPFHPAGLDDFRMLVDCHIRGDCSMLPQQVMQLFASALDNFALGGKSKAQLLTQLASYYGNVLRDLPAAVNVLSDVSNSRPENFDYRVNLIRFLIAAGHAEEALREIDRARQIVTVSDLIGAGAGRRQQLERLAVQARGESI